MAINKFEAKAYWKLRVDHAADLSVVGHRAFGYNYNKYIYQRRLDVLKEYLHNLNIDAKQSRVLDVGCGSGFYTQFWQENGTTYYAGLDISQQSIDRLTNTYEHYLFIQADIAESEFNALNNYSFDIITVFDVFYHITDDNDLLRAMKNISSLLCDNGLIIIFDQLSRKDYSLRQHVKIRNRKRYYSLLQQAGLEVEDKKKLFCILVPPVLGVRIFDFIIAGGYSLLGIFMRRFSILGDIAGKTLYHADNLLRQLRVELPNNEIFIVRKTGDNAL